MTTDFSSRAMFKRAHAKAAVTVKVCGYSYRVAFASALRSEWAEGQRRGFLRSAASKTVTASVAPTITAPRATDKQVSYLRALVRRVPQSAATHWIKGEIAGMSKADASRAITALQIIAVY